MELDFYRSPLIGPALGICIGLSIYLLKQYKHIGSALILIGFVLVTISYLSVNFCIGLAVLTDNINEYPNLCNSITPHVYGLGFFLIGFGIFKLAQSLNQNA